tara:strand:- start:121 stop:426 length:306 start_codon:yes stop_codon:yes gene_type:complete
MRRPEKIDAIRELVGGRVSGNPYSYKPDLHDGQKLPSKSKIDAKLKKLQDDYDSKQYQRDRVYPAFGEQLDMLFHDMTSGKGDKSGEWYKAIAKVKSDNPK